MAGNNDRFKPFLFADQPLDELVRGMNPPAGTLADALAELRAGHPDEAAVVLTAATLTRPAEVDAWHRLVLASAQLAQGHRDAAVATLSTLARDGKESRQRLWACRALQDLAATPTGDTAGAVLGVVVEVHVGAGVDTLSAYDDGTARYLLNTGARVVWDAPDERLAAPIQATMTAARVVAPDVPAAPRRDAALEEGRVRVTLLTGAGARPFEDSLDALTAAGADHAQARLFGAATELLDRILAIVKW